MSVPGFEFLRNPSTSVRVIFLWCFSFVLGCYVDQPFFAALFLMMACLFKIGEEHIRSLTLTSPIIIVEGIIGAGKSTFIRSLMLYLAKKGFSVRIFEEDIDKPFLDHYLADQSKKGFAFQINQATSRRWQWLTVLNWVNGGLNNVAIADRCGGIGGEAFSRLLYKKDDLSAKDYELCQRASLFDKASKLTDLYADSRIIYLDVSPETAMSRIKKRGIESEIKGYTIGYLTDLRESYRISLMSFKNSHKIDWDIECEIDSRGSLSDSMIESVLRTAKIIQ